jgi:hypothetical protein
VQGEFSHQTTRVCGAPPSVRLGPAESAVVSSVGINEITVEVEAETLGSPKNIDVKRIIDTARHKIVFFTFLSPLLFVSL